MTFACSLSQIPTDRQIRRALVKVVFGRKGPTCPWCCRANRVACLERDRRWRCARCRKPFSLTSVTWLRGCKLSPRHVWALVWCWQHRIQLQQAEALLGLSLPTVRRWYGLFRDRLEPNFEVVLEGDVQMDELFACGSCVMGAKQKGEGGRARLKVLSRPFPTKADVAEFVRQHVRPGSTLCTDGGGIYRGIERSWPLEHVHEIHSRFEFEITSEIEGLWGVFRTFVRRMYHHVTKSQLPKTVAEFEARFSEPQLFESPLNYFKNSLYLVKLAF
jgi:transposase-like protein